MTDTLRDKFWETVPLTDMTPPEWEALCDGCGKCCLNKLEFEDTGEVEFTRLACRLLDGDTCRCSNYENRLQFVPECVQLSPQKLSEISYWLPKTCAYRLLNEGKTLPKWHYLISGDTQTVHRKGKSVRGWTIPENTVDEEDWEDYIIRERP